MIWVIKLCRCNIGYRGYKGALVLVVQRCVPLPLKRFWLLGDDLLLWVLFFSLLPAREAVLIACRTSASLMLSIKSEFYRCLFVSLSGLSRLTHREKFQKHPRNAARRTSLICCNTSKLIAYACTVLLGDLIRVYFPFRCFRHALDRELCAN